MTAVAASSSQSYRRRRERDESRTGWLLAAPAALLLLVLLVGPTIAIFGISLTDWQLGSSSINWNGIGNYEHLYRDPVFWRSLKNTFFYVAVTMPFAVVLGLGAALLIEADASWRAIYRTAYFLPVTATIAAMAVVWGYLLNPSVGLVTVLFENLGLGHYDWLKNPQLALITLSVLGIWQILGLNMVLFMAGLKAIPQEIYDAADMDGADSVWERFRTVTWPMLGPTTIFVSVITAIRSFQVFDNVAILTQGGPSKATEVLLYTMYTTGFTFFQTSYAAALTVVFLIIILVLTYAQIWLTERRKNLT